MSIDISGMIQNMLHCGFTLTDCLSELIDNSLSARAKHIRIKLEGTVIYYSDDGSGMTKEGLRLSNIFHLRTDSASSKHGRFGIGGKQSCVQLSNKQFVTIYSKSTTVNMIELDYQRFISENEMHLHVSEIGMSSVPIWDKYSFKEGTLFVIQSTPEIVKQLTGLVECKNETNLLYHLGRAYESFLSKCVIEIVTDKSYRVNAIDLLKWESSQHYQNRIRVYSDGTKTAFEYSYHNTSVCRDFNTSKTGKQIPFVLNNLKLVGSIDIKASYREDWREVMVLPNEECTQEEFERLHGKFIVRNGKMVSQIGVKKKLTGDFDLRDTELNTHVKIEFQANEIMDKLFGVQINKSKLNHHSIDEHLWGTIEHVIKDSYKTFNAVIISRKQAMPTLPSESTRPYNQSKTSVPKVEATIPPKVNERGSVEVIIPPKVNERVPESKVPLKAEAKVTEEKVPPKVAKVPPKVDTRVQAESRPVDIILSKTDEHIVINDVKNKKVYKIAYQGQYHVHYNSLEETRSNIGNERFIEYVIELEKLNRFTQNLI